MLNRIKNLASRNSSQDLSLKVIITGCPRSGTSFLAGLVSKLGFNLGPTEWLYPANKYNKRGYFECLPLQRISFELLKKFGGDFHENIPVLNPGWTSKAKKEKRKIAKIISNGGIEMYKGNQLMVLADLYDELYPEAKWIYIEREIKDTFKSRFGDYLTYSEWVRNTNKRLDAWHMTEPSKKSLNLNYSDFKSDIDLTIDRIITHLNISVSQEVVHECKAFFMPKKNKEVLPTNYKSTKMKLKN